MTPKNVALFLSLFSSLTTFGKVSKDDSETTKKEDLYKNERFSYHFQFTTVGQHQMPFHSLYEDRLSLTPKEKIRTSVTSTLFLGTRLWKGAEFFFNPELSGGRGMSSTEGIAGFPNGEAYRVGDPEPVITISRCFLRQTISLGGDLINVEDQQNQLKGTISSERVVITAGKFSIVDVFDNNTYSHDPRNQFLNWAIMSAGAWDYPANTRGYTYALATEIIKPGWSVKASASMVPETANGPFMDMNIGHAHSESLELDKKVKAGNRTGMVRLIAYNTFADMGNYNAAIAQSPSKPDVTMTRKTGRTKTGVVVNAEQELTDNIGIFGRLSWNDGQNESWAFTEIDESANVGMQIKGNLWNRVADKMGVSLLVNGISKPHSNYLASGGYGFIIGDGKLNYGHESALEFYYSARLFSSLWISPDYQFIVNPAYNKDRGPVNIIGIRGHIEF